MGEKIGEVYVDAKLKGDIESQLRKVKSGLQTVVAVAGAAVAAMAAISVPLVRAASEAEETRQKFRVTFRGIEDAANEAARVLQESYGLSIQESENLLASTGDLLTGFGFTRDAALNLSSQVQRLSVDLASFQNLQGGSARASEIITKAMLGERDALVSLGVKISEEDLKQRALAEGMRLVNGRLTQQQTAQLTLRLITEQSANAVGDFARSQNSFANQTRILGARFDDLKVTLGNELLPTMTRLVGAISNLATNEQIIEFLRTLVRGFGRLVGYVSQFVEWIDRMNRGLEGINNSTSEVTRAMQGMSEAQREQFRALQNTNRELESQERLLRSVNAQGERLERVIRLQATVRERMQEMVNAGLAAQPTGGGGTGGGTGTPTRRPTVARGRAPRKPTQAIEEPAGMDVLADLRSQSMSELEIIQARNDQELKMLQELRNQEIITHEQYSSAVAQMDQNVFKARVQQWQDGLQIASGILSQLGSIFSMMAQNQINEIQTRANKEVESLNRATDEQAKFLKETIKDKKKLDEALQKLEENRTKKEEAIRAKAEEQIKKEQIEAFKKQQVINVMNSIMNTALAVTRMLAAPVLPPVAFALAALVGSMGAFQTALIAQQKPPAMLEGGVTQNSGLAMLHPGETVISRLDSNRGRRAIDQMADSMLESMENKRQEAYESEIIPEGGATGETNITIQLADEVWYTKIRKGTENRLLLIDGGAIINQ